MTQTIWPPRNVMCAGMVVIKDVNKTLLVRQTPDTSLAGQWSIPWIEPLTEWVVRRVLHNHHQLLKMVSDNPFSSQLAFFKSSTTQQ